MYRQMKLITPMMAAVVLVLTVAPAAAQSAIRIGVFDSQRVSEESAEGKRIQAALSELGEAKQAELDGMEQALNDLQQRLSQQQLSLSAEKRKALELDIQRKALELNNAKDLANREFQLEVSSAEAEFNDKLRLVVAQFGMDESFSVLLEAGAVAWSANSVDVTTAIIDMFNKMYPAAEE